MSGEHTGAQEQVAVYGTLLSGFENHERAGMDDLAFVGECVIPGLLYDLGAYPGLKLDGEGRVAGELYRCGPAALDRLDRFEGATGDRPLYRRRRVTLVDPEREAWVYEYARPVDGPEIQSGDWRTYRAEEGGASG